MARQQEAGLTRWQGNRGRGKQDGKATGGGVNKMARQQGAGLTRTVVSLGSLPRVAEPRPSHTLASGERETCQGVGLTR